MSIPRKTFARKMAHMYGYTDDEAIREVAYIDGVDLAEAERRLTEAREQRLRRRLGQFRRAARKEVLGR